MGGMSKEVKDLIVGLDIGTSKIVAIVAELTPEGRSTSSASAATRSRAA
jgi:cell division protein FtsA